MRGVNIPKGLTGLDAVKWVYENADMIKTFKKAAIKHSDAISGSFTPIALSGINKNISEDAGVLKRTVVINSCYWYDSHGDVHIPTIWNKSIKETKAIYLLNKHIQDYESVITDKVSAYVQNVSWENLGVKKDGFTECLVFDVEIPEISKYTDKQPPLYAAYKNWKVNNHSVGMYYVEIKLAIKHRDSEWKAENETWDKYIGLIANKEEAEEDGMFWAVTQAKVKEGSAVLYGSNSATPTIYSEDKNAENESEQSTNEQPLEEESTDLFKQLLNFKDNGKNQI